jgi:hypothetical protein
MKHPIFATAVLCLLPLTAVAADEAALKAEAQQITGAFFGELKGELVKAMKAGGPVNAIGVCHDVAPSIAETQSEKSGWDVARTSLKLRNPANAPDDWETAVLKQFEERRAQGEGPDTLAFAEVVEEDGETYYRFMKGIVMPPIEQMPCLACHGQEIDAKVAAKIDELYPDDQASGYVAGQVRGAFTLKKKL